MNRPAKPARGQYYFDADVLGLAKIMVGIRGDVTYPSDPGGKVKGSWVRKPRRSGRVAPGWLPSQAGMQLALSRGASFLLIEVGGEGRWSKEEVDVQRRGLRRAAQLAGVLPGDEGTRPRLPVLESTDMLSEHAGLWFPDIAPGTPVTAGTRLGRLEDPFGAILQEALAPVPGVLAYGLSSLAAVEGDLLACIAWPAAGRD